MNISRREKLLTILNKKAIKHNEVPVSCIITKDDKIIKNTKYGLYAEKMGGGSVNPATGEFNFAVAVGYLVEDGKITKPVRGATLVGSGPEILMNIDMIADNLECSHGMCGSESGSIPTNVGQPTIRVSHITVGGKGGNK